LNNLTYLFFLAHVSFNSSFFLSFQDENRLEIEARQASKKKNPLATF